MGVKFWQAGVLLGALCLTQSALARNQGGESFRITGFYTTGEEGVTGMITGPLSQTLTLPSTLTTQAPEFVPLPGGGGLGIGAPVGGNLIIPPETLEQLRVTRPEVSVGLENNMINQGIMLERFHLRYDVVTEDGELFSGFVPNEDYYATVYLPPAKTTSAGDQSGIRIQLGGQEGNRSLVTVLLVGPQTVRFLLDHSSELPEFPFEMIVRVKAFGKADNGKVYETPEAVMTILWIA
jgi:hypothetical protein